MNLKHLDQKWSDIGYVIAAIIIGGISVGAACASWFIYKAICIAVFL